MKKECSTCEFYFEEHCCNGLSDMCTEAVSKDEHCDKWGRQKNERCSKSNTGFKIEK